MYIFYISIYLYLKFNYTLKDLLGLNNPTTSSNDNGNEKNNNGRLHF